jgi:hypothetical protein
MKTSRTYYEVLGVAPESGEEEIRKAYYSKVKFWHPDVNASPIAHDQFIKVKEAYERIIADINFETINANRQQWSRTHHLRTRKINIEFTETWQGRLIYILMHSIFAVTGLLIFLNPLIIMVTKSFDPQKSLADSLFAAMASMIFGITMTIIISISLFSFIRRYH